MKIFSHFDSEIFKKMFSVYKGHQILKKQFCIILPKNGLGYILDDILTSSSGHPAHEPFSFSKSAWPECRP
jgi:hypothetical protein